MGWETTRTMTKLARIRLTVALAYAVATIGLAVSPARAEEIVVSNYGTGSGGFPYAICLEKGFFKQEGLDITGVISSEGGGTTVRNMIAGGAVYSEMNPAAFISAVQQGAKLRMISDNVPLIAGMVWAVKPDSPIKTLADIKGHKLGYTNPKSTSQGLSYGLLQAAHLTVQDVELVKTGGFGEGVAAVDLGIIDIAPVPDTVWLRSQGKLRAIAASEDVLPALSNVVGVATIAATETQGDKLRAILRARRNAVRFMYAHPDEAADIAARAYRLDPGAVRIMLARQLKVNVAGRPYFNEGRFYLGGIDRMLEMQVNVGAVTGAFDVRKVIDMRFLPEDLQEPSQD
jgi:NitT/TauT family transport system substrate-binding protein